MGELENWIEIDEAKEKEKVKMNKSESHGYYDGIGKASKRVGYSVGTGSPLYIVAFWLWVSVSGSIVKAQDGNCDKNYPIDSLFITNLFCEIKQGE